MAKNKMAKAYGAMSKAVNKKILEDREAFGQVAVKTFASIALITLNKKFGFGPRRLQKFQKEFEFQCECLTGSFCSLEDMEKLADELAKRIKLEDVNDTEG